MHFRTFTALALAAALVSGGVFAAAATTANSNFKIGVAAGTTQADCTKKGGKVETRKGGAKWCTFASSERRICLVYKPGHQGDDRYCSQSVPAPN